MASGVRDQPCVQLDKCRVCGSDEKLKVCARCKKISYCSKEHQQNDWPTHKKLCKKLIANAKGAQSSNNGFIATAESAEQQGKMARVTNRVRHISLEDHGDSKPDVTYTSEHVSKQGRKTHGSTEASSTMGVRESEETGEPQDVGTKQKSSPLTPHSQNSTTNNNNHTGVQHQADSTNNSKNQTGDSSESGSSENFILETESFELRAPDYKALERKSDRRSNSAEKTEMPAEIRTKTYFSVVESRNKALSEYVIKCLNTYGVCVIDNFLGDSKGTDILDEVVELYESGCLTSGQVVKADSPKGKVRGDVITWLDGSEDGCANVTFLISSIDAIMLHCQRALDHYSIKGRSKAMVAAYPGNATGFLRHVDNPSGDGRCVTCIYYLNKNWNSKVDGGMLKIYPESESKVANVEPKFDRLLFFWSDRRNPHEVMPAYRTRFAVTVWYYDQEERRRAVKKFKGAPRSDVSTERYATTTKMKF